MFSDFGVGHTRNHHKGSGGTYIVGDTKQAKSGFDLFDPANPANQSFTSGIIGRGNNPSFDQRRLSEKVGYATHGIESKRSAASKNNE